MAAAAQPAAQPPPRFLAVARTDDERNGLLASTRAVDRAALSVRDRGKLHDAAIYPLPTKFSLLSLTDDKDHLKNTYNIMMRTNEFFARLDKFDMGEPFYRVIEVNEANPGVPGADVKSLQENSAGPTEAEVRKSNDFYSVYGQAYDVQNLMWSQELLENSCEQDLRDKVMESLNMVPKSEQGGPLFYYIMMSLITSSTAEAVRTMTTRITSLKIRDLQGEDIDVAVSTIRGAMKHLTTANSVPPDIQYVLIDIFSRTSSVEFNEIFNILRGTIKIAALQNPNVINTYTVETILRLAERNYHELKEKGEWNAPTERSFVTCWNCGEDGHMRHECPRPQTTNNGRGRNQGRGPGRGRGGPTGGRGGGRGGGRSSGRGGRGFGRTGGRYGGRGRTSSGRDGEHQSKPPKDEMQIPPKTKGYTTRNIGGIEHYWCHICHHWNRDHHTTGHDKTKVYTYAPAVTGSSSSNGTSPNNQVNLINQNPSQNGSFQETIYQGTMS